MSRELFSHRVDREKNGSWFIRSLTREAEILLPKVLVSGGAEPIPCVEIPGKRWAMDRLGGSF